MLQLLNFLHICSTLFFSLPLCEVKFYKMSEDKRARKSYTMAFKARCILESDQSKNVTIGFFFKCELESKAVTSRKKDCWFSFLQNDFASPRSPCWWQVHFWWYDSYAQKIIVSMPVTVNCRLNLIEFDFPFIALLKLWLDILSEV